jgi:hypothetical protein
VIGGVTLHVDYTVPVPELRARAKQLVEASPLWDGVDFVLQVIDTTETTMVVRALASARDAPASWDLRCEVREGLLDFLRTEYPEALPVSRVLLRGDGALG